MLHSRLGWSWLLLPVVCAGCSSTAGSRFGGTSESRSIAVVGDRPLPASTGEPGGEVAADVDAPEPRRNIRARISGRVFDDRGRPAPGVTVRLADGGMKGGKDIRATTDKSGGFTLGGLRPGSRYWLIAESEDDRGPLTGRVQARTSDIGVEITLAGPGEGSDAVGNRPGQGTRTHPISNREEVEGATEPAGGVPGANREDVGPADGEEPEESPLPAAGKARPGRPQLSAPQPTVGWRKGGTSPPPREPAADHESVANSATDEPPVRRRTAPAEEAVPEEDDQNPLPPAIDPGRDDEGAGDRGPRRDPGGRASRQPVDSGELVLAAETPSAVGRPGAKPRSRPRVEPDAFVSPPPMPDLTAEATGPRPLDVVPADSKLEPGPGPIVTIAQAPPGGPPPGGDPFGSTDPPRPAASPPPAGPTSPSMASTHPASEPVFASPAQATPPPAATPPDDYNPFDRAATMPVAAPAEVLAHPAPPSPAFALAPVVEVEAPPPPPADAPPRAKWGEVASNARPPAVVEPTKVNASASLVKRLRPKPAPPDSPASLCNYDPRLRKLVDFQLPDLEGKPVRFHDLDADFVLLDFWGTWCGPCLDSIPHLVALQKQYGPRRLKVVGIACERADPEARKALVDEATRKLGINYSILLSGMDGKPCPVLEKLQVQAFPTLFLLDRSGQIRWRGTGATPATLERLDRVLASSSRADTVRR